MGITNKYRRIPLEQILVDRDQRQRQEDMDTSDIDGSIRDRGVLQPIIVEWMAPLNMFKLIAGERRLISSRRNGLTDIPARLAADLTDIERQIIELEENVKRKQLHWKDEVLSVRRIHQLYALQNETWSTYQTAAAIGIQQSTIVMMMRVAEEIAAGNKLAIEATGWRPAYNAVARKDDVAIADAMNDLLSEGLMPVAVIEQQPLVVIDTDKISPAETESLKKQLAVAGPGSIIKISDPSALQPAQPESVFQTDFVPWSAQYTGKPFSFVHCDFPYGINLDKSEQGNTRSWGGYEDSPETYWKLCTALCKNLDRVMMQSGHLMFWCSSDHYVIHETLEFFKQNAPSLEFVPVPVIWHKTDGKGILSDHRRRARHVYETALVAARGDRYILRSVGDTYGAPSTKEFHQSEKSEAVLRHFFAMFVDENTRMLDPTCGSGGSLRAAESLGASYVLGLDINGDFVNAARVALRRSRLLRAGSEKRPATAVSVSAGIRTE